MHNVPTLTAATRHRATTSTCIRTGPCPAYCPVVRRPGGKWGEWKRRQRGSEWSILFDPSEGQQPDMRSFQRYARVRIWRMRRQGDGRTPGVRRDDLGDVGELRGEIGDMDELDAIAIGQSITFPPRDCYRLSSNPVPPLHPCNICRE